MLALPWVTHLGHAPDLTTIPAPPPDRQDGVHPLGLTGLFQFWHTWSWSLMVTSSSSSFSILDTCCTTLRLEQRIKVAGCHLHGYELICIMNTVYLCVFSLQWDTSNPASSYLLRPFANVQATAFSPTQPLDKNPLKMRGSCVFNIAASISLIMCIH